MLQPRTIPAPPIAAWLRSGAGRRALGLGLAVLIEAILILLMLTMARVRLPGAEEESRDLVAFDVQEVSQPAPEERPPETAQRAQTRPEPQRPQPEQPAPPQPPAAPTPPVQTTPLPMQWQLPPAAPRSAAPAPVRPVYGPPDTRPAALRDTEVVGRAPNGEPLYAAAWYREPDHRMLGDYLSTSQGPGWGLIACKTAPGYRVEQCVPLEEYPSGSQINRSILAAAWEFRVRPPRRGGRELVGSWVRIRITYDLRRSAG